MTLEDLRPREFHSRYYEREIYILYKHQVHQEKKKRILGPFRALEGGGGRRILKGDQEMDLCRSTDESCCAKESSLVESLQESNISKQLARADVGYRQK